MHGDPAHRWTLQELARTAGMSRSTFAERFKRLVGSSPMDYLTRWRMGIASQPLANTNLRVSEIAARVGYVSEFSFSRAFKRMRGMAPTTYRYAAA